MMKDFFFFFFDKLYMMKELQTPIFFFFPNLKAKIKLQGD